MEYTTVLVHQTDREIDSAYIQPSDNFRSYHTHVEMTFDSHKTSTTDMCVNHITRVVLLVTSC